MKLSVVIPAHNESFCIESTVTVLSKKLLSSNIDHEILVVNDNSTDRTEEVLKSLEQKIPHFRFVNNLPPHGFGSAVSYGLGHYRGDAVAVFMADASDNPDDLVHFFRTMESEHVDCVFGTRFHPDSKISDYPIHKLLLNRFANKFIQILFGLNYNDITNAFKLYRKETIEGLKPFLSQHFNLTVELPLKAIVRGYSYVVLSNDWTNRKSGISKLKIKEMGSRYLFIVLYCFIEKWLSRGDYHRLGK